MSNTARDHCSDDESALGNTCVGVVKDAPVVSTEEGSTKDMDANQKSIDYVESVASNANEGDDGDNGMVVNRESAPNNVESATYIVHQSSMTNAAEDTKVKSSETRSEKVKSEESVPLPPVASTSETGTSGKLQEICTTIAPDKKPGVRGRKRRGRPPNASRKQPKLSSDDAVASSENLASVSETAMHLMPLTKKFTSNNHNANGLNTESKRNAAQIKEYRWRAHRAAEDYINLVGDMMYPGTYMAPFGYSYSKGNYPIERPCTLGLLTSPLRRPTVIEKWSPYEIACFEAALTVHGKLFHIVQKVVKTKSTKEIIEFYYIWKKTSHYKRWKQQLEPDVDDHECEELDWRQSSKK